MAVGCGTVEVKPHSNMTYITITEEDYIPYGLTRRDRADIDYMFSFNACLSWFKVLGHTNPFVCKIENYCFVKEQPEDTLMVQKPIKMCEMIRMKIFNLKEQEEEDEWFPWMFDRNNTLDISL